VASEKPREENSGPSANQCVSIDGLGDLWTERLSRAECPRRKTIPVIWVSGLIVLEARSRLWYVEYE
jgi:hypothetical protein